MHWVVVELVLGYLLGTIGYDPMYASTSDLTSVGYSDSYWVGSVEDRKSTSGCCFSLGFAMVSWFSRKQMEVALSTAKVQYIAT